MLGINKGEQKKKNKYKNIIQVVYIMYFNNKD